MSDQEEDFVNPVAELEEQIENEVNNEPAIVLPDDEVDFDDLSKKLDTAKDKEREEFDRKLEEAQRRAEIAEAQAKKYQTDVKDSQLNELNTYLANLETREDVLSKERINALQNGDYELEAKLNKELQTVLIQKGRVEQGKTVLEQQLKNPVVHQEPKRELTLQEKTAHLAPKAQAWVLAHPETWESPTLAKKLGAAHEAAVSLEGIPEGSDEYFQFIEEKLGYRQSKPKPEVRMEKKPSNYSAPPSKDLPISQRVHKLASYPVSKLTAQQKQIADAMGYSHQEYADYYLMALKNGDYDNFGKGN